MFRRLVLFAVVLFATGVLADAQRDVALYLMGKAAMEDGTRLPKELRVQLVCEGLVVRQTYPAENGTFSIDLGSVTPNASANDASASAKAGGLAEGFARSVWNPDGFTTVQGKVYLDACFVGLASASGFAADNIQLGIRRLLDNPDIGVLVIRRLNVPRSPLISVTTARAPERAQKALDKAKELLEGSRPDAPGALKELAKAVRIYPSFSEAWYLQGEVQRTQGDSDAARVSYERAVASDPPFVNPYLGLAQLELEQQHWEAGANWAEKVLERHPESRKGRLYLGLASYYRNQLPLAQESLESLEKSGGASEFPTLLMHLGLIYARQGNIVLAAEKLREYLRIADSKQLPADRRMKIEQQLALWESRGLIQPN